MSNIETQMREQIARAISEEITGFHLELLNSDQKERILRVAQAVIQALATIEQQEK